MKRSDAIKLLSDELFRFVIEIGSSPPTEPDHNPYYDHATLILNFIQYEIGMLPPKTRIITNPDNPRYPELQNVKELVNEWEAE